MKEIIFWDDTFTIQPSWILEFCTKYQQSGLKAKIVTTARVDFVCKYPDIVKRMAEIGIDWLVMGLESGSQRLLDLINKGTTVEQNYAAAEIARKHGMKILGTYMLGLPTETPEESQLTAKMIHEIAPEMPFLFWYKPIPGTNLYNYCVENKLLLPKQPQVIARTGVYEESIKDVDYNFLRRMMAI